MGAMVRTAQQATPNTVIAVLIWKLRCVYLRTTHIHEEKTNNQDDCHAMCGYAVCDWALGRNAAATACGLQTPLPQHAISTACDLDFDGALVNLATENGT